MVLEDVRPTNFEVPLQVKSILFFHLKIYNCYKERKEKQKPQKRNQKAYWMWLPIYSIL